MSCPHQEMFSCESCIKEAIVKSRAMEKGTLDSIFERYRDLLKERDELLAIVKAGEAARGHEEAWDICRLCYNYINFLNKEKK